MNLSALVCSSPSLWASPISFYKWKVEAYTFVILLHSSTMTIVAVLMVVFLGLLFLVSGLIVNFLQALCYITIRPFSKSLFRRINRVLAESLWLQMIWLYDWWAGCKIEIYADDETFRLMGKEHALVIPNHKGDIDWLVGWLLAQRSGCLGSTLAVMKKSSKFLPVIGWSMWFSEYLFLDRNWAKDENTLKLGSQCLKGFPLPFWLAFLPEGTRLTQAKLLAAQEYAKSNKLPIPRNVLIPRTKGFVSLVNNMRSFVPAVYDVTVVVPKDSPPLTMLRLLGGKPTIVHVYLKRYGMDELPHTDEGLAQWCRDIFVAKDSVLDKHMAEGSFDAKDHRPISRPLKSLLVVIGWSALLLIMASKFAIWTSIFSTRKGIAFLVAGLLLVIGVMYTFILFSQSERSMSRKVASSRQKAE